MHTFTGTDMDFFAMLITEPREALRLMPLSDTGYRGFWVLLLALVSMSAGGWLFGHPPALPSPFIYLVFGTISRFVFITFLILIFSALYHYFAEMFGGKGGGMSLFKALPYSSLPFVFTAPAALIIKAIWPRSGGSFLAAAYILLAVWSLYFQIGIIKNMYDVPPHSAAAVFIIPWAAAFAALVLMAVSAAVPVAAYILS